LATNKQGEVNHKKEGYLRTVAMSVAEVVTLLKNKRQPLCLLLRPPGRLILPKGHHKKLRPQLIYPLPPGIP